MESSATGDAGHDSGKEDLIASPNLSTTNVLLVASAWAEIEIAITALQRAHDIFAQFDPEELPARSMRQKMKAIRTLARDIRELASRQLRDAAHCSDCSHDTTSQPSDEPSNQPSITLMTGKLKPRPYMIGGPEYEPSSNEEFIENIFEMVWGEKGFERQSFTHLMDLVDRFAENREINTTIKYLFDRKMVYGLDVDDLDFDVKLDDESALSIKDLDKDAAVFALFKYTIVAAAKAAQIYADREYGQQLAALEAAGVDEDGLRISYAAYCEDTHTEDTFEMFVLGMSTLDPSGMARLKESAHRLRSRHEGQDDGHPKEELTEEEMAAVHRG